MSFPLYDQNGVPETLPNQGHAGLWWDKFFCYYANDWSIIEPNPHGHTPEERLGGKVAWIHSVCGNRGQGPQLKRFAGRQYALGRSLEAEQAVFTLDWHFVTGLGLSHPVENGFAWHPTLGVPYLPASGVKGLLRAWVEEWASFDSDTAHLWFGNDEEAGGLIFFDAVPIDRVRLAADVITPHGGQWYADGGNISGKPDDADAARLPADWHSPIPVTFLVVKDADLFFQIAPCPGSMATVDDAKEAMEALKEALEELGAGAKTGVGYGRMLEKINGLNNVHKDWENAHPHWPPLEELTEVIVTMVSPPHMGRVQVKDEQGRRFFCPVADSAEALQQWQSADREFFANLVIRGNRVIRSYTAL